MLIYDEDVVDAKLNLDADSREDEMGKKKTGHRGSTVLNAVDDSHMTISACHRHAIRPRQPAVGCGCRAATIHDFNAVDGFKPLFIMGAGCGMHTVHLCAGNTAALGYMCMALECLLACMQADPGHTCMRICACVRAMRACMNASVCCVTGRS